MSLELPQARDADVLGDVVAVADAQAARGKAPNNQMISLEHFMTACVGPWIIVIKTSS